MKNLLGFIFIFSSLHLKAQVYQVDFSYQYLASKQWDRAIQSYNFSRPNISQNQGLLIHGISNSFSYLFQNQKPLKHGFSLDYSFTRSNAENKNFDNSLHLHLLQLSYLIQYNFMGKTKGLYTALQAGMLSSALFRRVNGEPLLQEDTRVQAYGVGLGLKISSGYNFQLRENFTLGPFFALGCSPYFFSPNTEGVINQTKGLSSKAWTSILYWQLGFRVSFS